MTEGYITKEKLYSISAYSSSIFKCISRLQLLLKLCALQHLILNLCWYIILAQSLWVSCWMKMIVMIFKKNIWSGMPSSNRKRKQLSKVSKDHRQRKLSFIHKDDRSVRYHILIFTFSNHVCFKLYLVKVVVHIISIFKDALNILGPF